MSSVEFARYVSDVLHMSVLAMWVSVFVVNLIEHKRCSPRNRDTLEIHPTGQTEATEKIFLILHVLIVVFWLLENILEMYI